jgi:hypothetical protein
MHDAQVSPPTLALLAGPGEVFDRRGIDRLKAERLDDAAARARAAARVVQQDRLLAGLVSVFDASQVFEFVNELDGVNAALWDLESEARALLRAGAGDAPVAAVARRIFGLNDRRAALKRALDAAHGQAPGEDKGHALDP